MSQPKIYIPKPCHENWNEMTPEQKGRFCNSCQKTVYDFTKSSDRTILQKINTEQNVCGRFLSSQLDRELVAPKSRSTIWTAAIASVLSFANFENNDLQAQEKPDTIQTDQTIQYTKGEIVADLQNEREIAGLVLESALPMPTALVTNTRTQDSIFTDFDGLFKIKAKVGDELKFSFLGYHTQNYIVNPASTEIRIHMQPNMEILDGSVITGGICVRKRTFFGRIFHSIGNWFQ